MRKFISIDEYKDIDRLHGIFPHSQYDILYDELHIALSKINKKEKIAFLLFEIGGFSIEEIRIIQKEKSASAIKSRLSRTRAKLKEIIDSLEKNRIIGNSIPTNNIELDTIEIINNIKP